MTNEELRHEIDDRIRHLRIFGYSQRPASYHQNELATLDRLLSEAVGGEIVNRALEDNGSATYEEAMFKILPLNIVEGNESLGQIQLYNKGLQLNFQGEQYISDNINFKNGFLVIESSNHAFELGIAGIPTSNIMYGIKYFQLHKFVKNEIGASFLDLEL
jgi:hypothetical protein